MAKKKKKTPGQVSWCWYCDRTFEDDRVLLQHQKAKHFRCPHCPRRLNTAGGLAVHIDQVHKLGTDKIENTLPGRESFDIEIYGMEGIPPADLAAWKKRNAEETGQSQQENRPKKPKYSTAPLTAAEIQSQLAAHKALMSGQPLPGTLAPGGYGVPPPGFGMPPGFMAPPPFMMGMPPPPPGFIPPVSGMPFPPPPFAGFPPGMPPPPGFMPPPPGSGMPLPFPPPPFSGLPSGIPPPPPGVNLPFPFPPPGALASPAFLPLGPDTPTGPAAQRGQEGVIVETLQSSAVTLKPGTLLVYGDNEISPEEKRAKLAQYKLNDIEVPASTSLVSESEAAAADSRKRARATDFLES